MKTLSAIGTLLLLLIVSAPATAKTTAELMDSVPGESPMIVGLEFDKIKSSYLFKETMGFFEKNAKEGSVLQFVLSKKPFDFETDLDSAVVAFKTAPTNPQQPPPPAMAVITGRFDQKRVKTSIAEQYGKPKTRKVGKLQVHTAKGVDFAFADANTLVIAESAFAAPTWKAVTDKKSAASANAEIQDLLSITDTTRGVWFAVNTRAVPSPPGAPPMDGAGIAMDLRKGLALDFNSKFANADDAKKAKDQFDAVKKTGDDDKMLEMLGAKPLVQNMTASVQGERILNMNTAITDAQVRLMVKRIKAMNEQPPPVAPSGGDGTTTQPTRPTGTGTKADFN